MERSCFYGQMANEETNLFNRRDSWNREDALDEKYLEFLAPHSHSYFSRLRPLFSFEIKSLNGLNSFSHVLFRDGIVFLLRFFINHPNPQGIKTKILIDRELAFCVPQPWRDHVLLYDVVMKPKDANQCHVFSYDSLSKAKNIVIILDLHENQEQECLKSFVEEQVEKRDHVYLLPFFNQMRGEDFLSYDRAENLMSLKELFSEKVTVLNASDVSQFGHKESVFLHANPQKIFQSDSNVVHSFLRSGWKSPSILEAKEQDFVIGLGPNHGMRICPFVLNEAQETLYERLHGDLKFPTGALFKSEPVIKRELEDYFKVFYYSNDLLKLSFELGRGLFKIRNNLG